jgi:copper chaperone CopZ
MNHKTYIHGTPGRLRIRTEAIKNNESAAAAARELLQAIPGVHSTAANPLTGSITVIYDTAQLSSARILAAFRQPSYLEAERKDCECPSAPMQPSFLSGKVASAPLMEASHPSCWGLSWFGRSSELWGPLLLV